MTDEWMARMLGVQESYTDPETTYRAAKARGMTHVTLTDRDTIQGALRLAGYPDFVIGEEVTAFFPSEALHVDVLVWGHSPTQHEQIQRHRFNIFRLVDYLNEEELAFGLAHPASFQIGGLRAEHFEQLLVLFPLWEVRDGHSDVADNALVARLLQSSAERCPSWPPSTGCPCRSSRLGVSAAPTTAAGWTSARRSPKSPSRRTTCWPPCVPAAA